MIHKYQPAFRLSLLLGETVLPPFTPSWVFNPIIHFSTRFSGEDLGL
jgi:hypothetical protein